MTDLTEKFKAGELEALEELINQIATVDDSRSLSDEYLKEKGLMTREELDVAAEYPYGIVMVTSDYVLPYLKEMQENKKENQQLKELLGECREVLKIVIYGSLNDLTNPRHGAFYLLPKIDNAIGEK